MEWHTLEESRILKELSSSRHGLSETEARKRLEHYGPNELVGKEKLNPFILLLNQFKNFLVIILLVATAFSFAIGEILDGSVILVIVVVNSIFGFVQEYKADKAIEALKRLTSPESIVMRDGKKKKIPSNHIVPGDIVFLDEGSKIPADMRLLEAVNLKIDEASLTGESAPVKKIVGVFKKAILAERKNMAFSGTHVTYGHGFGIIVETAMHTEIGKIAKMIEDVEDKETPLQLRLKVFSKNLGMIILAISITVIAGGILRGYETFDMILTGIALAVAAIPEGLPAVVTITLALGLQKMSKENALVRRLPAVETLGSTSVICSDKTGTITRNEMTVRKIWLSGKELEVTGRGYSREGGFFYRNKPASGPSLQLLLRIGALCNNASLSGKEGIIGDPTEAAIMVAAAKGGSVGHYKRVGEMPFSSERKMMSTINLVGGKKVLHAKGAPEVILGRCTRILLGGKVVGLDSKKRKEILEVNRKLANQALRILGFAYGETSTEKDLIFVGLMGMIDPPRDSVKKDIAVCRQAGIRVVMITGDHKGTAVAVAKEVGLHKDGDMVLTGEELERMDSKKLHSIVEQVTVYARVNPLHKVRIVDAFKQAGHIVAMTGDGVNDAPALKKADIGIAMGIKGTDVSKEASDMILTDDRFSSIVSAIKAGRGIYTNITKFINYLLSSNIAEVLIVFIALIMFSSSGGNPMLPLLAVQILWINLLTDGFPALALGVDPPLPGVMKNKPRPMDEKLLSRKALVFILLAGAIITAGTLWVFYTELYFGLQKAQTMAFTTLVVFELFNVFNVRGFLKKNRLAFFSNKKLHISIALSFILQIAVIYAPPLQEAFKTVGLGLEDWIKILLVSLTVLAIAAKDRFLG